MPDIFKYTACLGLTFRAKVTVRRYNVQRGCKKVANSIFSLNRYIVTGPLGVVGQKPQILCNLYSWVERSALGLQRIGLVMV